MQHIIKGGKWLAQAIAREVIRFALRGWWDSWH
jgi:hypothetical protein